MTKVIVNKCWGGFSLSRKALHVLRKMGNKHALEETDFGESWPDSGKKRDAGMEHFLSDIPRDDSDLIKVVKEMAGEADGDLSCLVIINVPDDKKWRVEDYDGMETIIEDGEIFG